MAHLSSADMVRELLRRSGIDVTPAVDGGLNGGERFWRNHCLWLKERGYTLRKRYQPDWVPSWKTDPTKTKDTCEDGVLCRYTTVLDATRSDGSLVVLKRIASDRHEADIGNLLSSEPLASHPSNHCIPILDVLEVPDDPTTSILVMPYLHDVEQPPFETIGEVVEFFRQIFDALNLMHENYIAHRDIKLNNIMADTFHLFDPPPHPSSRFKSWDAQGRPKVVSSRIRKPVKYYLIDYGLSKAYKPEDAPFRELTPWGGDKTAPEFGEETGKLNFADPFPVDVYCMGNLVRNYFLEGFMHHPPRRGFRFMQDLVQDMVQADPKKRPTMAEVVLRYEDIVKKLSNWKLRSRVVDVGEPRIRGLFRSVFHWVKQVGHISHNIPPIPRA